MTNAQSTAVAERGSKIGMLILNQIMKFTGPGFIKLLVVPVALYYFITSAETRTYSRQYLTRIKESAKVSENNSWPDRPMGWLIFRHILAFSTAMVDRVNTWSNGMKDIEYKIEGEKLLNQVLSTETRGAVFLMSHLGNFDLAIARSEMTPNRNFTIVMDTRQTTQYNELRDKNFKSDKVKFISPDEITPVSTITLVEGADNGDILIIAADRVDSGACHYKNTVTANFFGQPARFSIGPYVLSHLLEVPVYTLFAFTYKNQCRIYFELFENEISLNREHREEDLCTYVNKFANRLERYCIKYPLQWFNFYNYWADPEKESK